MATVQNFRLPTQQAQAAQYVEGTKLPTSLPNGLQALGRGISEAGAIIDREQEINDQLRGEEKFNKLRDSQIELTLGKNGYLKVEGKNALPQDNLTLSDRYSGAFKEQSDALMQSLSNDRQKQIFKRYAARAELEFKTGLLRHENQQLDSWRKQTIDGVFAVEADNAAKNWNNPEAIGLSRSRIDLNLERMREADGTPAEQINKIRLGVMSRLHSGVLENAIAKGDTDYAAQYLKQYGDEIEAGTLLKANTLLGKQEDSKLAFGAARSTIGKYSTALEPNDFDRAFNITLSSESSNRQFDKDGKPLTSKAGAIGIAQVMPTTGPEAAKLAGLPWDENRYKNDANYNAELGRAYFAKQLQTFGGNVQQAWAAYNAGPRWVKEAVARASAATQGTKESDWFWQLNNDARPADKRKETQDYVAKNSNAYSAGLGTPQKPTFADLDAALLRDNPGLAQRPEAYKQAREQLKQQYEELDKAGKQRKEEAEGEIYKQLIANGGDFNALPVSLRAGIDQSKITKIMEDARKIKNGVPTDTNTALYQKLTTDPTYLKSLSEGQLYAFHGELSQDDFKHFTREWAKLNGRTSASAEGVSDVNSQALNMTLNQRLSTMGIDPTPKDTDKPGMARVGAIRQFITRSILDAQAQSGKKFTDADTVKHIDNLFVQSTQLRNSILGFDITSPKNVALLSMAPSDVPSDARRQIRDAFKKNGAPDPSEADILQAYWMQRFKGNDSALSKAKAPKQEGRSELVDKIPR